MLRLMVVEFACVLCNIMITIAIAVLILRDILQSYGEYLSLSFFILFVLCLFDKVTDTFLHH